MLLNGKEKSTEKEDYLKLEDEMFKDVSLDEIYNNAKDYWHSEE